MQATQLIESAKLRCAACLQALRIPCQIALHSVAPLPDRPPPHLQHLPGAADAPDPGHEGAPAAHHPARPAPCLVSLEHLCPGHVVS